MSRRVAGSGDAIALAAVGGVALLATLVWLWGGIAGTVFGAGWAPVRTDEVLGILVRLPRHLADPSAAWPQAARPRLPGPAGAYTALGLLLAAVAAPVLVVLRAIAARGWIGARSGSRWARPRELRALRGSHRSRRPAARPATRLALGRSRGRVLRAEARHALIAFGPPQSGKSAGLAIPALLEWEGPVVASSIKTDLMEATIERRRALGQVFIFDPFALSGQWSHGWSPLHGAGSWDGAIEVAWRLAAAGELDHRGVEGGDFWAVAAEQRLAPLLYAAAASGARIDSVVRWVYGQDGRGLAAAIQRLVDLGGPHQSDARAAYDAARAFDAQPDRTRASIEGTAQTILRAYRMRRVARSAERAEITADAVIEGGATLYLIGDAKASKLLRPLFVALIGEIVDRAYEHATLAGGELKDPLLLCLDEAGNVAPLPGLAEIASTAPSHNIQLVSIFHDLAQARSRYDKQAETVVNSHRARMLLPGVGDLDTLRYFSGLIGEADVHELTRTTGNGGASRSVSQRRQPLASAERLRQLPDGRALLLYGRLPPVVVRLRMWFRDRRLGRLAQRQ